MLSYNNLDFQVSKDGKIQAPESRPLQPQSIMRDSLLVVRKHETFT